MGVDGCISSVPDGVDRLFVYLQPPQCPFWSYVYSIFPPFLAKLFVFPVLSVCV